MASPELNTDASIVPPLGVEVPDGVTHTRGQADGARNNEVQQAEGYVQK